MNRIAVVTGAGRGIGKVVSRTLAANGWTIVAAGRDKAAIDSLADEVGNSSIGIVCDVSDSDSVKKLFSLIREKFGRIDLLFNNAGVVAPGVPIEDLSVDDWRRVIDTNIGGTFFCTQQAFALMKSQLPQGGRIINNGSLSAQVPRPNSAPYTTSKHAISGLTKSTSLDGRPFNIACGQIDIGNADTDMAAQMHSGVQQPNGSKMVEPTINPQHVADAVLYMANLPLEANVQFMTVMATTMPFIGRG